jgi:pimeloyl-ACP methyl ester carboxylesterase
MKASGLVALGAFAALCACSDEAGTSNPIGAAAGVSGNAGMGAVAGAGATGAGDGTSGVGALPIAGNTGAGGSGVPLSGTSGSMVGGAGGEIAGAPAPGAGSGGAGGAPSTEGTDPLPPIPLEQALPIVFVHGYAGSAQQYQSQAMRFVANGYPPERIVAYEHDGAGLSTAPFVTGLGQVIDGVLAEFGTSQVFLVGHSRGTSVSSSYLGNAQQRAKVAKYIAIDGSPCPSGVPCIAPNQAMFSGQRHVEVCTSKESFAMQYEFLLGTAPQVVDVVRQRAPVEISGRAVNFPANTGRDGATLKIYPIDTATGARTQADPIATFAIGADGNWGPTVIDPDSHYEMELSASSGVTTHFYTQRILRSTPFVRLLSGPPDSPTRMNTHTGAGHATMVVSRQREWLSSDVLEIATSSPSGGERPAVNAMTMPGVGAAMAIGIHIHDAAASPGDSTLGPLPYFSSQPFQYGVDVFMPAADPPDGVITLRNLPRGDTNAPQVLNVPNWASSQHHISIGFSDFPQL